MFFQEIKNCLDSKNFLGALALSLILPEVFGKYAYDGCINDIKNYDGKKCTKPSCDGRYCVHLKYKFWYDENIRKFDISPMPRDSDGNDLMDQDSLNELNSRIIDGHIVYKLRNCLFHEGNADVVDDYRRQYNISEEQNFEFELTTSISTSYLKSWTSVKKEEGINYKVRINVIDLCKKIYSVAEVSFYKNPTMKLAFNGVKFNY